MVSAWYEKGNVMAYLDTLGDAATAEQRLKLVSPTFRLFECYLRLSPAHRSRLWLELS